MDNAKILLLNDINKCIPSYQILITEVTFKRLLIWVSLVLCTSD